MAYLSHATRIEICRLILLGQEAEAFDRHDVSLLDQALLRRKAYQALSDKALKDAAFKRYSTAQIARPYTPVLIAATTIVVLAVCGLLIIAPHYKGDDTATYTLASTAAGLLAVCAAAIGWAVAAWITYRNARVQHTINFIANRFSNDIFSKNAALFNEHLAGKLINSELVATLSQSSEKGDIDTLQALRYLVNYFEFIAVGVLCGDLDIRIIRRALRGNIIFYTDRCMPWILELQASSPRTLEHLIILRAHFKEP
jgi:hypothetical protein